MAWFRADVPQSGGGGTSFDFLAAATGSASSFELTDTTIGGTSATKIPQYMFYNNKTVRKLNLASITVVEQHAFHYADALNYINLPECVTLGESAFDSLIYFNDYPNDSYIILPKCKTIGASAFKNLRQSTGSQSNVDIIMDLRAVETIGAQAFRGQGYSFKATKIELPKLKTVSGAQVFAGNHTIGTMDIGDECTDLNNNFLQGATVTNLIVRATTPPTLGSSGLGATPTHIYVPASAVGTYTNATDYPRWAQYSSVISAIPEEEQQGE